MRSNPGFGESQHPISVQPHITPQSLFCFALDSDDIMIRRRPTMKTMSGNDFSQFGDSTKNPAAFSERQNEGVTTPTGRRAVNFFGTSTAKKVKDDSQALKTRQRGRLEDMAKKKTWKDEIE